MLPRASCAVVLVLVFGLLPGNGSAQEFSIYTRVFNEAGADGGAKDQEQIVGRSLSFFHAGKAYDYIDNLGEVTIFEPAAGRFTILDGTRRLATSLTLEELKQMLSAAEVQAEKYLLSVRNEDHPDVARVASLIEFQLRPKFEESFDAETQVLRLSHPQFTYVARCAPAKSAETVTAYLRYADWTARLNYLLHPQALLPGPRLALNESLRRRQMLPVEVSLRADIGPGIRMRAEHRIQWQLDQKDRQLIHQWESQLASPETRTLPFPEFQQALVAEQTRKRK